MPDPVSAVVALGWGMKAAGWVVSPIISELFKKGSSYLGFDASEKLKGLETKLLLMERVMEAVEESPDSPRLEQLFNDLKLAFYEAEDILDDVDYCRLENQIQDDKNILEVAGKKDRIKKIWSGMKKSSPLLNQESGMSKIKLKQSLDKIERVISDACEILERMNLPSISNAYRSHAIAAKSRGAVTTATPPPVVIGRDKDCDKIIAILHEGPEDGQLDISSAQCYSVIGIHGIAGSGKSTLAQLVCSLEKKDGHFDLVMWVHVSQDFTVDAIFKEMLEATTRTSCPHFNNFDTLQNKLEAGLKEKRFLLVLDDVWYNTRDLSQYLKLQQILSPLNTGGAGSKILVTSRTEDALLALGASKRRCIPMFSLDNDVFRKLFMHYALHGVSIDDHVRRRLEDIGTDIAKKLKGSPLAARIVGGQLCIRPNIEFWRRVRDRDLLNETMGALWWSYQHLDEQVRRCFAYCSMFPRRYWLKQDDLIKLWTAEGFVRCNNEGEEMEDVCRDYFDELVSASFLQLNADPYEKDHYLVHDLLHDLAEKVAGSDSFGIENHWKWTREDWPSDVPPDVRHMFVQTYDGVLITEKICALHNLRTLIIDDSVAPIEEEVLKSLFERLRKLRVLSINIGRQNIVLLPASISKLRHLRYLAFRTGGYRIDSSMLILPVTVNKLYHMRVLDFGINGNFVFSSSESMSGLINLRHIICNELLKIPCIGRLTSLWIETFRVRKEQGHELKQLRNLNKLRGQLTIRGLENVRSSVEALEAKLADKKGLRTVALCWNGEASPEAQTLVLDGLCPPKDLESLRIFNYGGLRYPSWMMNRHDGGPKYLRHLKLISCIPKPGPELVTFSTHLRWLAIWNCSWEALPNYMEHLTSLQVLDIIFCMNFRSLPRLPRSLQEFTLEKCNEVLMSSCKITGDPNWQKIQHILCTQIDVCRMKLGVVVQDLEKDYMTTRQTEVETWGGPQFFWPTGL
ncbi:unnamed protein product [Alopecurus aequalis]